MTSCNGFVVVVGGGAVVVVGQGARDAHKASGYSSLLRRVCARTNAYGRCCALDGHPAAAI